MLPTNVVSFVKKMVSSEGSMSSSGGKIHGGPTSYRSDAAEAGTTLSKLRHTLTSVTKLSPTRPSTTQDSGISSSTSSLSSGAADRVISTATLTSSVSIEERSLLQKVWSKAERFDPSDCRSVKPPPISTPTAPVGGTFSPLSPPMNGGPTNEPSMTTKSVRPPGSSCRVCVKAISDAEYFKRCSECSQKVCEDCASYSSTNTSEQDTWHCSICRRRLLSRVKKETSDHLPTNLDTGTTSFGYFTDSLGGTMAKPSQSFSASALSLVSGLASMASSLTSSSGSSHTATNATTSTTLTNKLAADTPTLTSVAAPSKGHAPLNARPSSTSETPTVPISKPLSSGGSKGDLATNGVPRQEARRPSRNVAQKSIERTSSKEEIKERKVSTCHKGKDLLNRDKTPVTRRRSDNEEEIHHSKPAVAAARRGHRVSDYMLRGDPSEDQIPPVSITLTLKGEPDSLLPTNITQRQQEVPIGEGVPKELQGESEESSMEDPSPDGRKGRRRSIVRQKSYDEDTEDNAFLTLWSTGQLPVRRHSAQDPSRKSENPEFRSTKESSLDVPQGRSQRHHSWDYDISRGSQGQESLLPNATPAQCSRFSSESDMSNESISERGSMMALGGDDLLQQKRPSRASTNRRSSYRATRGNGNDIDDYANKGVTTEALAGCGHGDSFSGVQNSIRKHGGTSSLEDDPLLHPTEDEWRGSRRRSSAVSDNGRVLPTPPASPRVATYSSWGSGGSQVGRSSQSMESASSRDMGDEILGRQSSVADGEAIKIVINDVDTDFVSKSEVSTTLAEMGRRRVKIKREMDDPSHRGGGVGMRIVGGKVSGEGTLMATVVWTVPGGPAERVGIRQGDKVLEWNGVYLVNRSFEDVCSIIEADEGKEVVDVLLEAGSDGSSSEGREDNPLVQSQRGSLEAKGSLDSDLEKSLMSVSRRKLPKIPGDLHRAPVSGKVQVQMWFDKSNAQFIATIISAHDLRHREGYVPPEAFVCLRLFPHIDSSMYTTGVSDPSTKPLWNSSFLWESVSGDSLMGMTLELSVWDGQPDGENGFLGECLIDLRHAYLDERPTWYRLQERRSRSANTTPRGSIAGYDFVMPIVRRPSSAKSGSDYHDGDDSRHSSIDSGLLHPDLAWRDSRSNSRRGSSLSEQAECEVYQLTRSYPHSLPQSRRSSFAVSTGSPELRVEDLEARLNVIHSPAERRRAHSVRVTSQRELLQEAGWKNINQTPSWLSASSNIHSVSSISSGFCATSSTGRRFSGSGRSRSNSLKGGELQMLLQKGQGGVFLTLIKASS